MTATTTATRIDAIVGALVVGIDRADPRVRHDIELTVGLLEAIGDAVDGYATGATTRAFGAVSDEAEVVLQRRLANAHHRLAVADRHGQLSDDHHDRVCALAELLLGSPARADVAAHAGDVGTAQLVGQGEPCS